VANIFGTKHDVDKQEASWKLQRVPNAEWRFLELWSTNGFKWDQMFFSYYFLSHL